MGMTRVAVELDTGKSRWDERNEFLVWTILTCSFPVKCCEGSRPLFACMGNQSCPFVPLQTSVIFQTGCARSEFSICSVCSKHCQSDSISDHFIDQQGFEGWIIPTDGWTILPISAVSEYFFCCCSFFKSAVWLSAFGASLLLCTSWIFLFFHQWLKEKKPVCCDKEMKWHLKGSRMLWQGQRIALPAWWVNVMLKFHFAANYWHLPGGQYIVVRRSFYLPVGKTQMPSTALLLGVTRVDLNTQSATNKQRINCCSLQSILKWSFSNPPFKNIPIVMTQRGINAAPK